MSHWETELKQLLAALGVSLEEHAVAPAELLLPADLEPGDLSLGDGDEAGQESDLDADDLRIVNQEVEATVREVARLVRSGRLEPELRDDVVRVLSALSRTCPADTADRTAWEITSAAAVLHFCRIVLRLANAITWLDRG